MARELRAAAPDFMRAFADLLANKRETAADVDDAVAAIIAEIRKRGDAALAEFTARFDRHALPARIGPDEIDAAEAACDPEVVTALRFAAARIESFHSRQKPADHSYMDDSGVKLGWRWTALARVGLYVPGGTASYPSSVLMNAIPARVAGVRDLVIAVPTPDGRINPLVLVAARIAGVTDIFRIGGAQAVAALAYGTEAIPAVDKIVGPGNAYVAAAKRRVFGQVGIDMIAGPSEILVVADGDNNPDWIAADLLSQAEHDESAQSLLISDDEGFALRVAQSIAGILEKLPRAAIAGASWDRHGAIILVGDLERDAPALVDAIAPEHLELALDDDRASRFAGLVRNAGSIFLGRHTPEAVGDYVGGPNHVLPTARSARFSSGLGVLDFMKRTTLLGCDARALAAIGPAAVALAGAEGLGAHALSVSIRLGGKAPH